MYRNVDVVLLDEREGGEVGLDLLPPQTYCSYQRVDRVTSRPVLSDKG